MTKKQKNMLKRIVVSLVLFAALMVCEHMGVFGDLTGTWLLLPLYAAPYLIVGYDIIYKAFRNIRNGQIFDENFLMMLATFGAFGVREYSEAAAVMLFYQVGELFQGYAVGKSRQSIADMMDICPEYANIEQDGEIVQVDPDEVGVGSIIIVKPGERIPLDGIVAEGESYVDTAALTGESVPRKASAGEEIFSGCVNGSGTLKIKTTKEFDDSTVAKILELVENAGSKKAKTEKFITKFAKYYTPFVTIAALLLAFLPPIITGGGYGEWIRRACTFLVISCPCALVISVPLGFFGGIGAASRMGVLVKGGNFLEAVAEMTTIVFDKTGTLTKGMFQVTKILPAEDAADAGEDGNRDRDCGGSGDKDCGGSGDRNCEGGGDRGCEDGGDRDHGAGGDGEKKRKLLELAALGEGYSNHPIAASIREAYGETGGKPDMSRVDEAEEIAGHGICAKVDGREILLGNEKLMQLKGIAYQPAAEAGTIVYAACEKQFIGALVISDVVKEGAAEAIRDMKRAGVKKCVMLTGDRREAAEAVAAELGIDEVHAELLPADKVRIAETLLAEQKGKGKLAFAGDGINDAPVLTRADIGIAMGSMGSDAAIEAADVVLMDDDVQKIAAVVRCARKTLTIVKQNIVFALGVKALVLILGALGMANMWEAVFADVGVAVLAILNSMRALKAS